jgi:hypothetical protein
MTLKVEYFTNMVSQAVSLSGTPVDGTVAMDIISGTAQALTADFAVDGTMVRWDNPSYNLFNVLDSSNDQVRIIYDRS